MLHKCHLESFLYFDYKKCLYLNNSNFFSVGLTIYVIVLVCPPYLHICSCKKINVHFTEWKVKADTDPH